MKVLVIRFSALGDIVLCSSLVERFCSQGDKVWFCTKEQFKDVYEDHVGIESVVCYQPGKGPIKDIIALWSLSIAIRRISPDLIVDAHSNLRSRILSLFLIGFRIWRPLKHSRERRQFVRSKNQDEFLKLGLAETNIQRVEDQLATYQGRDPLAAKTWINYRTHSHLPELPKSFIVMAAGASSPTKRWPTHKFQSLIDLIHQRSEFASLSVVVTGAQKETEVGQLQGKRVLNLQGKLSIKELIDVVARSTLVISNDSAAVHIAEAQGVRVLSLFGATSELFGFKPFLNGSKVLSSRLDCRPCSTDGRTACSNPSPYLCLEQINASDAFEALKEMLGE